MWMEKRIRGVPVWAITSVTCLLLLVAFVLGTSESLLPFGEATIEAADADAQRRMMEDVPADFGGSSRHEAALDLFLAWKSSDTKAARQVAGETATGMLFSDPYVSHARYLGCGFDELGYERCAIRTKDQTIMLSTQIASNGRHFIDWIERYPADFGFTADDAEPSPSG